MATEPQTANMGLYQPVIGITQGPQYAIDLNKNFGFIDAHDHSQNKGVQITPSGMNISADLPFNGNNATAMRTARFTQLGVTPTGPSDYGCIYTVLGLSGNYELCYRDTLGRAVQLTVGGSVNGSAGTISGMGGTSAAAAYIVGSSLFQFQSGANLSAKLDCGSLYIRNDGVTSSPALLLSAPTLTGSYTLTLPPLPGSQKFMTLDGSGVMSAPWSVDSSTIEVASNVVRVKDQGIVTAKLADGNVTRTKLASVGQQISAAMNQAITSASYVSVTNGTVTITTTGRPVVVCLITDPTAGASGFFGSVSVINTAFANNVSYCSGSILIVRGAGTVVAAGSFGTNLIAPVSNMEQSISGSTGCVFGIDTPAAGTYTYTVKAACGQTQTTSLSIANTCLMAYEL